MHKIAMSFILLVTAFVCLLPAAPAQAAAARTFVSAAGSDSNNCTNVATPCRHLAAAFTATAADGEIYVLDPANYGSLTITHAVSIEGHGWASIAPVSGESAIIINTPNATDKINIIGVVLDGTAVANTNGIAFFSGSGGTLTVRDSVIRNFTLDGILFEPNASTLSRLFVSNTVISDNGGHGIDIEAIGSGTVSGVLNHVDMENNTDDGLLVSASGQTISLTVSDSVSANNAGDGIGAGSDTGTPVSVMVRNCTIANNLNGLFANGTGATIRVTRSTITGNTAGWAIAASGVVTSYTDNNIDGNGSANTEPPGPLSYK